MKAFFVALALWLAAATAPAAEQRAPIDVTLKGLVCSFCARGLDATLRQQKNIDHFDIRVARGDVLIWPREGITQPTREQIESWVETSGLKVKGIAGL